MQELRLVAVSEDGSYAVLVVPGRSGRFALPIDERLRTVARGQFSRLAQYEIEVESPLRPKEIQDRIRAGETAEEIADAAGLPVERIRRFEGPVLAEREFRAGEAQRATVRGPGERGAGLRLGEVVTERLAEFGIGQEDQDWDSRKRQDGNWQVQLAYTVGGRMHVAEWVYDPRSKHVTPEDDEAIRLCLDESQWPGPRQAPPQTMTATVTPIGSRAAAVSHPSSAAHPVAAPSAVVTHPSEHRGDTDRSAGRNLLHPGRHAQATAQASQPATTQPATTQPATTQQVATQQVATQQVEFGPFAGSLEPAHSPSQASSRADSGPESGADSGAPAAEATPPSREPARPAHADPAQADPAQADQEQPQAPDKSTTSADAKAARQDHSPEQPEKADEAEQLDQSEQSEQSEQTGQPPAPQPRPAKRPGSRSRRSSVPSWDEIMFGNSRQPD